MKHTEKNPAGRFIVIGMIGFAALGAGLTWRNYSADHPSATRAEVTAPDAVAAWFAPAEAARIRRGAKAIVSREGVRSTAFVTAVPPTGDGPFALALRQPFRDVPAGAACEVTVDLSIPPELLRDGAD